MRPTVLSIAGSDSCGGAGIQADLKTIESVGGHCATVVTAITAQNAGGVQQAYAVAGDRVAAQLEAVWSDGGVAAVKIGMLGSAEGIRAVAAALRRHRPARVVLDPVLVSSSGFPLLPEDCIDILKRELLPLASVITPNIPEVEKLTDLPARTIHEVERAGRRLLMAGARAVLVTGGHLVSDPATDLLVTSSGAERFTGELVDVPGTHGTGCVFSAALAAHLAHGKSLHRSVRLAKSFTASAIRCAVSTGGAGRSIDPLFRLRPTSSDCRGSEWPGRLHVLTDESLQERWTHVELARFAAEGGADVVQFREKAAWPTVRRVERARQMLEPLAGQGIPLVVNDRVDVAVAAGASGVHLGREDLDASTARSMLGAGGLIGVTANSLAEARALRDTSADYLGVGPVFGTSSKARPAPALGLDGLRAIVEAVDVPVIAIGNITPDRVASVMQTGAHGIAVLSSVVRGTDPAGVVGRYRDLLEGSRERRLHPIG